MMANINFRGLCKALEEYDENGDIGKSGSWEVHTGEYDLCWEVCYKNTPVLSAIDAHLYKIGEKIVYIDNNCLSVKDFNKAYKIIQNTYGKEGFMVHPDTEARIKTDNKKTFSR